MYREGCPGLLIQISFRWYQHLVILDCWPLLKLIAAVVVPCLPVADDITSSHPETSELVNEFQGKTSAGQVLQRSISVPVPRF